MQLFLKTFRDAHLIPWLVFEYMEHGNLAEILRANSGIFSSTPSGSIGSNHHELATPTIDLVRSDI